MYQAMADALNAAREGDSAVRALLITGQPGVFTAGNDIEDFCSAAPAAGCRLAGVPLHARAARGDKPVVAAVTVRVGIGTMLLLHL